MQVVPSTLPIKPLFEPLIEDSSSTASFRGEKGGFLDEVVHGLKSPIRIQALVRGILILTVYLHNRLFEGLPADFRHFLDVLVLVGRMAADKNLGNSARRSGNPTDANRPNLLLLHAAFGPLSGRVEAVFLFVFAGIANLKAKASHSGSAESWSVRRSL